MPDAHEPWYRIARTDALRAWDVVLVPAADGALLRTVRKVEPAGYKNWRQEPVLMVWYVEPASAECHACTPATAGTSWTVVGTP
jgi:hypothetical protein